MVEKDFGSVIKCLRNDNGDKYISASFTKFCQENGIRRQMTCPNTPQQNGVVERKLAHLTAISRSWLHDKNLPKELWAAAMHSACHVINRLPPWPSTSKSLFELLYKSKPNASYFRIFGSLCYVHVPKSNRAKLDSKAFKCVFIGHDSHRKGWKCMDPVTKKVVSRDVMFDKVSTYYTTNHITNHSYLDASVFDDHEVQVSSTLEDVLQPKADDAEDGPQLVDVPSHDQLLRRSMRDRRKPDYLCDYDVQLNACAITACFLVGDVGDDEPRCYREAQGIADWEVAMQEEISALYKNGTWELVPKPKDARIMSYKWVYKLKKKADGSVQRYKARLVARGFSQEYGLDYEDTFSPVAKMVIIRVIVSLAAYNGWLLWQLNVKNAFIYGDLDRDIYMKQPPGPVSKQFHDRVCRLKKALYGLKQAPRAWYGKISQFLIFCGFNLSNADSSLFVKMKSSKYTVLLLYADDMIITEDDENEIAHLKDQLAVRFEMKNMDEAQRFLGLEVHKTDGYFVSQKSYAESLLVQFGMENSTTVSTRMEPSLKLRTAEGDVLQDVTLFRQMVGSLFYLTITRPDIAYSVCIISQFMQQPCLNHLVATKRILRYVKRTMNYGLFYKQQESFSLYGFTDADWAGDVNDKNLQPAIVSLQDLLLFHGVVQSKGQQHSRALRKSIWQQPWHQRNAFGLSGLYVRLHQN